MGTVVAMKVRDLIAELQRFDPDLEVVVAYDGMHPPLERVKVTEHAHWENYPCRTPKIVRRWSTLTLVQQGDDDDEDER